MLQETNNNNDLQAAQATEAAFVQEIQQTPKAALSGTQASAPVSPEPAPAQVDNSPFSGNFWKKLGSGDTQPQEGATPPPQEEYRPFADAPQPEEPAKQGSAAQEGDVKYNYLFIEQLKNGILSTGLGWLSQTPSTKWLLSPEAEQRLAETASRMKVKWIEEMDGGTQYALMHGFYYGPMIKQAYDMGQANRRNARAAAQVRPQGNAMQAAASRTVPFTPAHASKPMPANGERTRFDIHADGTYRYTRAYNGMPPAFCNAGSPEAEKVDLTNLVHVKRVIMKNGGWKKVAAKLGVPEEWMVQRGLDSNSFDIED